MFDLISQSHWNFLRKIICCNTFFGVSIDSFLLAKSSSTTFFKFRFLHWNMYGENKLKAAERFFLATLSVTFLQSVSQSTFLTCILLLDCPLLYLVLRERKLDARNLSKSAFSYELCVLDFCYHGLNY